MTLSERTRLGRTELQVSRFCLGGNVFGWTASEADSTAVLDAYVAAGGNFVDTADIYSTWAPGHVGGESETIVGKWLKSRGFGNKVVVATKVGLPMPIGSGLSRGHILRAVEDSLKRLQVERIEVLYAHRDDPQTPAEETVRAFDELVRAGKVRYVAASNFTADRLQASLDVASRHGLARYEALQPLYNLLERDEFEGPLQDLCVREGISVMPYYALASGFLTGKYAKDAPAPASARADGVLKKHGTERGWAVLDAVRKVAARHGATTSQVALAWLLTRPAIAAPIASARTVAQLQELLPAFALKLTPEDLRELDA